MKTFVLLIVLSCWAGASFAQKSAARLFSTPILTDTLSTLFIPTLYNEKFLSDNKIVNWNNYYANIVVYNFKADSYRNLFEKDTYIEALQNGYGYGARADDKIKYLTTKWVFMLVKATDTNKSGRIDEKDPSILFAVSTDGQRIKQLTTEKESVVNVESYQDQGFMLIKVQRDSDNDGSFRYEDHDFYFRKVNIEDLALGKEIEIR